MTNEKQTSLTDNPKTRDWGKIITLFILGVTVLPILAVAIVSPVMAGYKPEPQLPLAESQYEVSILNTCLALKQKGNARMQDDANGLLSVDQGTFDRNTTAKYRDMDCSKIKLNVSVDF